MNLATAREFIDHLMQALDEMLEGFLPANAAYVRRVLGHRDAPMRAKVGIVERSAHGSCR
jgi:hypothetical protein